MPNKLYKILLILGIAAVLVAVPAFWLTFSAQSNLEVNFLDVGQGDSTLIKTPYGQNILIDGGPDNTVIKRLGEELSWWDRNIDLIIVSHPHDDHLSGLIDVIKRYKVKRILYTGVIHTSPNYLAWLELVRNKKIHLTIIDRPQFINLGENCGIEILYPFKNLSGQTVGNINNSSIVSKLDCENKKFLFTGDAESEVEKELVEAGADLGADVLKLGHHGSDTSSSREFIEIVKPEIAIIQVGADNDFGHPSRRVLKRLERIGAKILKNDIDGTIRLTIEDDNIELKK